MQEQHYGISHFHPLTMLNKECKILIKVLVKQLQVVLDQLITPNRFVLKGITIQDTSERCSSSHDDQFRSVQGLTTVS